jgi:ABC-type lipopolysaccharide export system ATPase subunit
MTGPIEPMNHCPTEETLAAFVDGMLDENAKAGVIAHLANCSECRDVVLTASWAVVGRFRERYDARDEARAMALLDQFGVAALAGRLYGTLSEGERKRVQIARALMTDPELLLLDEPTAGLDLGAREDLVRRLADLAADPDAPAIVLVTHHVEEIPPGFTHGMLMRDGGVVAQGLLRDTITADNLSKAFGMQLRLSPEVALQLGYGIQWFPTVDVDRSAYSPDSRIACVDGGYDYTTEACSAVRAGYALPTAAGEYGRLQHAGRLALRYDF